MSKKKPVCGVCNDTHQMHLSDRVVPCTHCPIPCGDCRSNKIGAYRKSTPCNCKCHTRSDARNHTRTAWEKFDRGDHITDEELDALIEQTKTALPYLQDRPNFGLAKIPTLQTLQRLEDMRENRK